MKFARPLVALPRWMVLPAVTLTAILSSCGGGGGGSTPPPPPPPALEIVNATLPDGINGKIYSVTMVAANGMGTLTWSVDPTSGNLPPGLSLSTAGVISGTPNTTANFNFTIDVQDSSGRMASHPYLVAIHDLLQVTTQTIPTTTFGAAFNFTLAATGGVPPYTWTAPGGLPPGIALSSSGVLSGDPTPPVGTTLPLLIDIADSDTTQQSLTVQIPWTINNPPLAVATSFLPATYVGGPYCVMLVPPIGYTGSFSSAANLPPGITQTGAGNSELCGSPTAAGNFPFTVQFTDDSSGNTTQPQSLAIQVTSGTLARNDQPTAAVPLSNGVYRASISPLVDPAHPAMLNADNDYFQLSSQPGQLVNLQIFAARGSLLLPSFTSSPLDSVIEVVDAGGNRLNICAQPDSPAGPFNQPCLNFQIATGTAPNGDSQLFLQVPTSAGGPMTFYLHVLDYRGDARPDMLYDLEISGVN